MKRWFLSAAARARGQSNDLNREILASNHFNCRKEVMNAPPVPSMSRCIHIVYRHKNVWEYQWSNFIHNCMSTLFHYVHCKDALLDCSAPDGERCESLTGVDEIYQSLSSRRWLSCHPVDQPSVSMIVERTLVLDYPVSHCPTFSVNWLWIIGVCYKKGYVSLGRITPRHWPLKHIVVWQQVNQYRDVLQTLGLWYQLMSH